MFLRLKCHEKNIEYHRKKRFSVNRVQVMNEYKCSLNTYIDGRCINAFIKYVTLLRCNGIEILPLRL